LWQGIKLQRKKKEMLHGDVDEIRRLLQRSRGKKRRDGIKKS
jgi:hypothetical protein